MTMRVTMTQTRLGESGTLLTSGLTYTVSDDFGRFLVGKGYATDTDNVLLQASADVTRVVVSSTRLTEMASGGLLIPNVIYIVGTTWYKATSTTAYEPVGSGGGTWGSITGTIATQSDLVSYVAAQIAASTAGQVKVYKPSTVRTMPAGGGTNYYAAKVTVPAGAISKNSHVWVEYTVTKSGTTDAIATGIRVGAVGTAYASTSNIQTFTLTAGGRGATGNLLLYGNRSDTTGFKSVVQGGADNSGSNIAVGGFVTITQSLDSDMEFQFGGNCGTTDTLTIEMFNIVVFNPDATAGSAAGLTRAWQTVTPNVDGVTAVAPDVGTLGTNVLIDSLTGAAQPVSVPANLTDGETCLYLLRGQASGYSGTWTQWSSGSPSTPGWVFPGGAAPTASTDTSQATPIYIQRRGYKYIAQISLLTEPW